MTSINLILTLN